MIKHMTTLTIAPPPMCPIPQGAPSLSFSINHDTHFAHISHCPYVKKDVKLSKRCQVVKKMSNVKKSNTWTMEGGSQKKIN